MLSRTCAFRIPATLTALAVVSALTSAPVAADSTNLQSNSANSSKALTLRAKASKPIAGEKFGIQGRLRANPSRQRILIQRWNGTKWRTVAKTRSNKRGRFSVRVRAPRAQSKTWLRAKTKTKIRSRTLRIRLVPRPSQPLTRPKPPSREAVAAKPTVGEQPQQKLSPIDFRHKQPVAAGGNASCAIDTAQRAWCWGALGTTTHSQPTIVAGDRSYISVAVSNTTGCGLMDSGKVWCWQEPQLANDPGPTLGQLPGNHRFRQLVGALGPETAFCGVDTTNRAWCWGSGLAVAQGNAATTWAVPRQVASTVPHVSDITMGDGHLCVLDIAGSAWCWGRNDTGQLGSGVSDLGRVSYRPIQVAHSHRFRQLAAGARHTCGIASDGSGWCWGVNESGELGSGATRNEGCWSQDGQANWFCSHSPVKIAGDLQYQSLDSGKSHVCAVTVGSTGNTFCWGNDDLMRLGDESHYAPQFSPQKVPDLSGGSFVAVGQNHSCTSHGRDIWCWGDNGAGQLARGNSTERSPDRVIGGVQFLGLR